MNGLIAFLVSLIKALVPWAVRKRRPTAQEGDPDIDTREKLRKKVREFWLIVILMIILPMSVGCVRTIYVPAGTPVRLRETLKDVKVWVKDTNGNAIAGKMDLPEGWYALSVDSEDE